MVKHYEIETKQADNGAMVGISRGVTLGMHVVLVRNGTSRHKPGGTLRVPDNISLLTQPCDLPELNPVKNIWQFLRQNHLSNQMFATDNAIVGACCHA